MQKVPLPQRVADHLEQALQGTRLEVVVGNVPASSLKKAEDLLGTCLRDAAAMQARIEGSLACLDVTYRDGEKRFFPIRVEEARSLMDEQLKESRILIDVGSGIIINQCHQTGEVVATPKCGAADAFLALVRRG